jgi:hypothetical protein
LARRLVGRHGVYAIRRHDAGGGARMGTVPEDASAEGWVEGRLDVGFTRDGGALEKAVEGAVALG